MGTHTFKHTPVLGGEVTDAYKQKQSQSLIPLQSVSVLNLHAAVSECLQIFSLHSERLLYTHRLVLLLQFQPNAVLDGFPFRTGRLHGLSK